MKLLMATSSPGVAVFFVRLVEAVEEVPLEFCLHVPGQVAGWLESCGLASPCEIIPTASEEVSGLPVEDAGLILSGTDYGESLDAAFAAKARSAGKPHAYCIDFWSAMEAREEGLRGTRSPVLVPNHHAAEMLLGLNPKLDVRPFGHPEFERLLGISDAQRMEARQEFRKRHGLGDRLVCSFFSQPYSDHAAVYGIATDAESETGHSFSRVP